MHTGKHKTTQRNRILVKQGCVKSSLPGLLRLGDCTKHSCQHGSKKMRDVLLISLAFTWSRGRASCAPSRRSTRLQAAAGCSSGKTAWQTYHPLSKWDWRWPSLCRLDLERTGSAGEPLTDCAQGLAVLKQRWGDGAISTMPSRWIATAGSHRRWPTSSCRLLDEACTADDLATVTERAKACARKWENIVWRTRKKKTWHLPHQHIEEPKRGGCPLGQKC